MLDCPAMLLLSHRYVYKRVSMTKRLFPGILLFVLLVSAVVHYSQWDYPFLYIGYTILVSVGYLLCFLST